MYKAADTKYVKDNAALFSSDDPNTLMKRAFLAHTLMRKDHDEYRTERVAMMPALMPKTIESVWAPLYAKLAAMMAKMAEKSSLECLTDKRTKWQIIRDEALSGAEIVDAALTANPEESLGNA